jgi:hypothetical protein
MIEAMLMIDGLMQWMLMLLGTVMLAARSGRSRLLLLLTWLAIARECNSRLLRLVLLLMLRRMMIGIHPQEDATGNIHTMTGDVSGVLLTKSTGNLGLSGTGATRLLIGIGLIPLPDGRLVTSATVGRVSLPLLLGHLRPNAFMMVHHVH